MKIKNAILLEEEFMKAFGELLQKEMPIKKCLEISECIESMEERVNVINRTRRAIVEKYAVKDENGKIKIQDGTQEKIDFGSAEKEAQCMREIGELMNEDYELPLSEKIKIKSSEVSTPKKIYLLRNLIEVIEDPKEEKNEE